MSGSEPVDEFITGDSSRSVDLLCTLLPCGSWAEGTCNALSKAFQCGEKVAVACSGGSDSTALLCLLCGVFPEQHSQLLVLHYNHLTRGDESDADARWVANLAAMLGLPFLSTERVAGDTTGSSEQALRKDRIAFFHETMEQYGIRLLCTGHHRDDAAETLLMRLMRGSGIVGLGAPRPIQEFSDKRHLRPLLNFSKQQITEALDRSGIGWREDTSNAGTDHLRNRLRKQVMPRLEQLGDRPFSKGVARAQAQLREAEYAIQYYAERNWPGIEEASTLPISRLRIHPRAVQRWWLDRWLAARELRAAIQAASLENLLDAIANETSLVLPLSSGATLLLDDQHLSINRHASGSESQAPNPWPRTPLDDGCCVVLPDGASLKATRLHLNTEDLHAIREGMIPPEREVYLSDSQTGASGLWVRNWRAGDRYQPLGAPGTRKLQDCFVEKKIPQEQRACLPVLEDEAGILWVPGLPPAERSRLRANNNSALRLTYFTS